MRFCFVGHSFHRKTRSTTFIIDILRRLGDVTEYDSSPDASPLSDDILLEDLAQSRFDCYVFLQTEYIAERLAGLDIGRFVIIPMYDGAEARPDSFWGKLLDAEFISFSRALHERLRALECRSHYFQYFSEVPVCADGRDPTVRSAFFWERRPDQRLNLPFVLRLCDQLRITHLHVHRAPDFAHGLPANWHDRAVSSQGLTTTVSRWFDDASDLKRIATQSLFYFAPRASEGIGMSMIEAMAAGQIVVAPSRPTMNEYVSDRVSGLLYDLADPRLPTDLDDVELREMSRSALRRARNIHASWTRDIPRLESVLMRDGRRWATSDQSSHFVNQLQARARDRVWKEAGFASNRSDAA